MTFICKKKIVKKVQIFTLNIILCCTVLMNLFKNKIIFLFNLLYSSYNIPENAAFKSFLALGVMNILKISISWREIHSTFWKLSHKANETNERKTDKKSCYKNLSIIKVINFAIFAIIHSLELILIMNMVYTLLLIAWQYW